MLDKVSEKRAVGEYEMRPHLTDPLSQIQCVYGRSHARAGMLRERKKRGALAVPREQLLFPTLFSRLVFSLSPIR